MERLTKARCDALTPEGKAYRVTDEEVRALKFNVEPNGRKSWTVRYVTHDGKNTEATLGGFPEVVPEKARAQALKVRGEVRTDRADPAGAKREHRRKVAAQKASTFEALTKAYLAASEKGQFSQSGRPKAESTIAKERQMLNKHVLPVLGGRPIAEIRRREIVALLEGVASASGNGASNACLEAIRRAFAYGRHKELVEVNPSLEVRRMPSSARDVVASDGALRLLWDALEAGKKDRSFKKAATKPSEAYATAVVLQISLLTLQRRGEVVRMRREDVDLNKGLWTIPSMNKKERRKGAVPLSPWTRQLLTEAMERSAGDWVFPGMDGEEHVKPKTITRFLARLRTRDAKRRAEAVKRVKAGEPKAGDEGLLAGPAFVDITPHDLRRTGRTRLTGEELQIDEATAERVLNHSVGSRQQNAYDWNSYLAPKRAALNKWADELARIVDGREVVSNVVRLQLSQAGL